MASAAPEAVIPDLEIVPPAHNEWLARLVATSQDGDEGAMESLLQQFRPLLRSRMHQMWTVLQAHMSGAEWDDVEAQVHLAFLSRVQSYRPEAGVYFPHYIARMLDFDCRDWLRRQHRSVAVPFSQLAPHHSHDEVEDWLVRDEAVAPDTIVEVERVMLLRDALHTLTAPQQQVVWQCCVLGRTESEVAEQLQLSRSTVRNRLAAGLTRLRSFFNGAGHGNGEDQDTAEMPAGATRTGRVTRQALAVQYDYWIRRSEMAKDEKRPDLVGVGAGRPVLLQGIFDFEATGLKTPQLLSPRLTYTVPAGYVVGIRFFRAGVKCADMVCLSTVVNGDPHRLVPVAAQATTHISFAIVEPIIAGSQIEIHIASEAPGTAIIDVGCLLMPA